MIMRVADRGTRVGLPIGGVVLIIAIWHFSVAAFDIPEILLPSPMEVWGAIESNSVKLASEALATGIRICIGFIASVGIAVPLAVLVVQLPAFGRIAQPVVTVLQAVPKVALAPIVVVWFGSGSVSQTIVAALVALFPIMIEAVVGLRSIEQEMLTLARSMGSNAFQTFWKFRLPRAAPQIFSGLKVGATLAVIGAIVAEWIGGENGIALVILRSDALLDTALSVAAVLVLGVMGIAFYFLIFMLEILVTPRRPGIPRTIGKTM